MRSINLLVRIILVLPLLLLPAGCGGGGGSPAPAGPSLSRITVTPANATIGVGSSQQFTATGTFSDGSTQDLSTQVTWASNGVVTIGSTGLATSSTSGGTATITATLGTVTGSATLIVIGGSNAGANVMPISVNGSLCSSATSAGYFNKPCVSVTVCNPDGSACKVVSDLLLDTGSYGLRIFSSALTGLTLTQASSGTGSLAECIQFADGSTIWGPVKIASVQMGNEPAVQVPIQVIDASFGTPTSCGTPDATPVAAGFTGVLGVGPLPQDCGPSCANQAQIGIYFSCNGPSCTGASVSLVNQVQNPVATLPVDNNGVLVQLPAVTGNGLPSLTGSLILGIGTQANNIPGTPTVLPTDQQGEFTVNFNGATSRSFVDTGSNALFFASSLPTCPSPNNVWYCPPSTQTFQATMVGSGGSPSKTVSFDIGNANSLFSTGNQVFYDVGGKLTSGITSDFDWGLPFFMGKNVFIGISGTTTPLGNGPFIAFQ